MDNGLPCLKMRPPTDKELEILPHVMITKDADWDPSVLDSDPEGEDEQWWDAAEDLEDHPYHNLFDDYGNYRKRVIAQHCEALVCPNIDPMDNLIDSCTLHSMELHFFDAYAHEIEMDDMD